jgi:hypothetical protein
MTTQQWIAIGASLLGGGAVGAIITAIVTSHRNRIQPVYYTTEYINLYHEVPNIYTKSSAITIKNELVITRDNVNHEYENPLIIRLRLINVGNRDMDKFQFGITLLTEGVADAKVVYCESETEDRHHKVIIESSVDLMKPSKEVDFLLAPFNRGDIYTFTFFVTKSSNSTEIPSIQPSTSCPVKFVKKPIVSPMGITIRTLERIASRYI